MELQTIQTALGLKRSGSHLTPIDICNINIIWFLKISGLNLQIILNQNTQNIRCYPVVIILKS